MLAAGPPGPDQDPVLDRARAHLAQRGFPEAEYIALEGAPGVLLPEAGAEAGLLVLGSRGRGASRACCSAPTPWPRRVTPSARSSSCRRPAAGAVRRHRPVVPGRWWPG
ncbi:hypothetical protein SHKM778_39660 [Streptomyces sp. KM77-8]|uniref:Universal stress protein n=1 Tax=Streptomyces haneummycinicus TaxID=3074435 RepID=A0AAT9HJ87_9ACTN